MDKTILLKKGRSIILSNKNGKWVTICDKDIEFDATELSIDLSQEKYKHIFHQPFPKFINEPIHYMEWFVDESPI